MITGTKGFYINWIYIKMHLITAIALSSQTNVNQICSTEGLESYIFKGSLVIALLLIITMIFCLCRQEYSYLTNCFIILVNICWTLITFNKGYMLAEEYPNDCQFNISIQQVLFYIHSTTHIWVFLIFSFQNIVIRATSIPIYGLSLYQFLVNDNQSCLDDNIYYLIWGASLILILGIPYNFFMSLNKIIKGPYLFIVSLSAIIQTPTLYLIYDHGLNYKSDSCQLTYSNLGQYFKITILEFSGTIFYFILFSNYEKEASSRPILIKTQPEIKTR
ncbi:hypothetical protein pb186bvf_019407 [Paramecium bursaria]